MTHRNKTFGPRAVLAVALAGAVSVRLLIAHDPAVHTAVTETRDGRNVEWLEAVDAAAAP